LGEWAMQNRERVLAARDRFDHSEDIAAIDVEQASRPVKEVSP
jgi:hypothetical protein